MSTPTRFAAYQNAVTKITELRGVKLSDAEFEVLKDAAEGRLLESEQAAQEELLIQAQSLLDGLVTAERWLKSTADDLLAEIIAAGEGVPDTVA